MNFVIEAKVINQVSKSMGNLLTNNRSSIPILKGVLIDVTENEILFTVSDGTDMIVQRIVKSEEVEIDVSGKGVVPKDFFVAIRKMEGKIEVCKENNNQVTVKKGKTELSFTMMLADEYPQIEQIEPIATYRFSGATFKSIVEQTTFNAADTDSRPILQGVNMVVDGDTQQFACTDSHRLGKILIHSTDCLEGANKCNQTIPVHVLNHTVKIFDLSKDVFLLNFNNKLALANGSMVYYSRLLEGNYPDVNRLIPTEFSTEITMSKKELVEVLTLLQEVTDNSVVTFTLDNSLFVEIEAHNSLANGASELPYLELVGVNELKIGFSAKYFLQALAAFNNDSIKLSFVSAQRPFIIRSTDESDEQIQLILPVRTY